MTQKERMEQELIYDPGDLEIMDEQGGYMDRLWEFNQLKPSQQREKQAYMKETFAQCGENCYIELPFYANWGGKNIHFGDYVYANFNLTVVDDGEVYVGDRVMFGPNVRSRPQTIRLSRGCATVCSSITNPYISVKTYGLVQTA